jgi:hypothetical protein
MCAQCTLSRTRPILLNPDSPDECWKYILAQIAADSIDHLHRYIEMLFGVGTKQAKHRTDGDSK